MRAGLLMGALVLLVTAAPASAHFPQHVDATAAPNGTVSETSSSLPPTATSATITVKPPANDSDDFFSGVRTVLAQVPSKKQRVLYCVAIYREFSNYADTLEDQTKTAPELRLLLLGACLELAFQNPPAPAGRAASAACPAVTLRLPGTIARTSTGYTLAIKGRLTSPRRPPLRVSCRRAGTGIKLRLRPRSQRRSLRSVVGPKLAIGFANTGTRPVSMRTTFAVGS